MVKVKGFPVEAIPRFRGDGDLLCVCCIGRGRIGETLICELPALAGGTDVSNGGIVGLYCFSFPSFSDTEHSWATAGTEGTGLAIIGRGPTGFLVGMPVCKPAAVRSGPFVGT